MSFTLDVITFEKTLYEGGHMDETAEGIKVGKTDKEVYHEVTSELIASIAAKGLRDPSSLLSAEIRAVCASCLTQREPK